MKNLLLAPSLLVVLLLQSCASPPNLIDPPISRNNAFWCNERYLDRYQNNIDPIHLNVSKEAYMYAIASSIALQKSGANKTGRQWFTAPARLQEIESIRDKKLNTGFEATSFKLMDKNDPNILKEIIIAFAGSNEPLDWWTNLTLRGRIHYALSRDYVQDVYAKYSSPNSVPLTVAGYSLGGGLALHAIKNKHTSGLVNKAYVFNTSPKTYSLDISRDDRVWATSVDNEALKGFRIFMRSLGASIAPDDQRAEGFNLILKNPIEGHFNYILTRSILHTADIALTEQDSKSVTEPLRILLNSNNSKCGA